MATIAFSGGVAPLIALLKDRNVEAQEYALWSLSLATDAAQKVAIAEAGCVEPLLAGLVSGKLSSSAQEHAAAILSMLASLATPVRSPPLTADGGVPGHATPPPPEVPTSGAALLVRSGGIEPLVQLLRAGSGGAKRCAATALAQLARTNAATQEAIARAGAVTALLEWLPVPEPWDGAGANGTPPGVRRAWEQWHPSDGARWEQLGRRRRSSPSGSPAAVRDEGVRCPLLPWGRALAPHGVARRRGAAGGIPPWGCAPAVWAAWAAATSRAAATSARLR